MLRNPFTAVYLTLRDLLQHPLWTIYNGKRVQLLDVELAEKSSATPGLAQLDRKREAVLISCQGGGSILVRHLKTEGRKALPALQWWIGAARNNDSLQFG
jgi:methionyl-tRNA formyltransferase